jgi:hypothetical protein
MGPHQAVHDSHLQGIHSPLRVDEWSKLLQEHPDQEYVAFLIWGMTFGFRIGFDRTQKLRPSGRNLKSALEHPAIVSDYLKQESL